MIASPLVNGYLDTLRSAADDRLTPSRTAELVDEIREHIEAALADGQSAEEVLERLGSPAEIVAAEAPPRAAPAGPRLRVREIAAIVLLLLGAVVYVVGWFAGLVLLLMSDRWTTRDKLIGALVWPGGLGLFLAAGLAGGTVTTSQTCDSTGACSEVTSGGTSLPPWAGIILAIVLVVPPILTAVHLARSAKVPSTRT